MGGALSGYAVVVFGAGAAGAVFYSLWDPIRTRSATLGRSFTRELDVAGMRVAPEAFGLGIVALAAMAWLAAVVLVRPAPLIGALLLPMVLGFALYAAKVYVSSRVRRRMAAFQNDLEGVLRMLSGGVRVGLGLRQALVHVAEQSREPARGELLRVVGASNLGVSVLDALDELGRRMPSAETQMMARVVRVQAQAGGDLAGVLEGLAGTIRDRRRLERKVRALTSQGRATAWILGMLPLGVGGFIMVSQPAMRAATFTTAIGHAVLLAGLALDGIAIAVLMRLTKLDV